MFRKIKLDIAAAMKRDPAARSKFEVFMTYSGIRALYLHRRARWFHVRGHKLIARLISQRAKKRTGIEIHPGAKIGAGCFIDHGMGIVIGETTEIGDNCVLYQGVTLGGTGKDVGKRHPTLLDNVMVSAGASVLGPVIVGENAKIGAGAVVLADVPPNSTVVGIPGRVVKSNGVRVDDMDQTLPDPVLNEFRRLNRRIRTLEKEAGISFCSQAESEEDDAVTKPCPKISSCEKDTCMDDENSDAKCCGAPKE